MSEQRRSLSFGLERIVFALLKRPRIAAVLMLLVTLVAGYGTLQLHFDQDLRNVFRTDDAVYKNYDDVIDRFVDPENDLLLLVEGDIGQPETLTALGDLHREITLRDDVSGVFSPFSLRRPPIGDGIPAPLIEDDEKGLSPELIASIRNHPLAGAKILSPDGRTMLMVVTPAKRKSSPTELAAIGHQIEATAREMLDGTGLTATATGFGMVRASIVERLIRDQKVLTVIGAIIGLVLSYGFFRSVIASIMTAVPALLAGTVVFGAMGLLGVKVSVMTVVVPVLVMILGYADGMHLSYAFREFRQKGHGAPDAELMALRETGSAGLLTSLTTAVAFLSLLWSDVELITNFAWVGALGVFFGAFVVMIGHGLIATFIGGYWRAHLGTMDSFLTRLARPSAALATFSAGKPKLFTSIAVLLLVVFGALHLSLPAQYSMRENLPEDEPANAALVRLDNALGGGFPVTILVPAPPGGDSSAALERVGAVHRAVAALPGVARPLSLWSLSEWLGGDTAAERQRRIARLVSQLPPGEKHRFAADNGDMLITINVTERRTSETSATIADIEAAARGAGGDGVIVTGVTAVNATSAIRTINNLNNALVGSIGADLLLIALAFGSWRFSALAFLPNILPIVATGAMLYLLGVGLQFTSVIALTISFGIAVDDTIHYLNRFRLSGDSSGSIGERLRDTSRHIGPVMIATTMIIFAGLATTLFSELPTIALFGKITATTLAAALVCDLVFVPAIIAGPGRRWLERGKG